MSRLLVCMGRAVQTSGLPAGHEGGASQLVVVTRATWAKPHRYLPADADGASEPHALRVGDVETTFPGGVPENAIHPAVLANMLGACSTHPETFATVPACKLVEVEG